MFAKICRHFACSQKVRIHTWVEVLGECLPVALTGGAWVQGS